MADKKVEAKQADAKKADAKKPAKKNKQNVFQKLFKTELVFCIIVNIHINKEVQSFNAFLCFNHIFGKLFGIDNRIGF